MAPTAADEGGSEAADDADGVIMVLDAWWYTRYDACIRVNESSTYACPSASVSIICCIQSVLCVGG